MDARQLGGPGERTGEPSGAPGAPLRRRLRVLYDLRARAGEVGPDAEIVAWQLTNLAELGISERQAAEAVQWVQIDGTIRSGHEAIAAVLSTAGGIWKIIGRAIPLPGISWMAAKLYRLVAANRYRLPGSTPACAVTDEDRDD